MGEEVGKCGEGGARRRLGETQARPCTPRPRGADPNTRTCLDGPRSKPFWALEPLKTPLRKTTLVKTRYPGGGILVAKNRTWKKREIPDRNGGRRCSAEQPPQWGRGKWETAACLTGPGTTAEIVYVGKNCPPKFPPGTPHPEGPPWPGNWVDVCTDGPGAGGENG